MVRNKKFLTPDTQREAERTSEEKNKTETFTRAVEIKNFVVDTAKLFLLLIVSGGWKETRFEQSIK